MVVFYNGGAFSVKQEKQQAYRHYNSSKDTTFDQLIYPCNAKEHIHSITGEQCSEGRAKRMITAIERGIMVRFEAQHGKEHTAAGAKYEQQVGVPFFDCITGSFDRRDIQTCYQQYGAKDGWYFFAKRGVYSFEIQAA